MVRRLGGHRRRISGHGRGGFTLAELLVVLGLVVVMIGVLLPGVTSARSASRDAQALLHVRTVSGALLAQASDRQDVISRVPEPRIDASGNTVYARAWVVHTEWWHQFTALQQDSAEAPLDSLLTSAGHVRYGLTFAAVSQDSEYNPNSVFLTDIYEIPAVSRRFSQVEHPSEKVMLYEIRPGNHDATQSFCCISFDVRGALARFDGSGFAARVIDFEDHRNFDPLLLRGVPAVATWWGLRGRDRLIEE